MIPYRSALASIVRIASGAMLLVAFSAGRLTAQDESSAWTDLTISPRQISEPLLARRLFPDASQRRPGNAAVILLQLCCDKNPVAWDQLVKNAAEYLEMPAEEFAPEKAREDVPLWFVEGLRRAAFRKDADWQYPLGEGVPADLIGIGSVAEVCHMLGSVLVHSRADIAEGKINAALDKLTTALGVAAHLQKAPFLMVKYLVADRIAGPAFDCVQELIQHPQAPNLYWALTALPEPLIDLRATVDWERRIKLLHISEIENLDRDRPESEWHKLRKRLGGRQYVSSGGLAGFEIEEGKPLKMDLKKAQRELSRLQPSLTNKIESMSDDEVVVRSFVARYTMASDRYVRALLLPPPEALPLLRAAPERLRNEDPAIAHAIGDIFQPYARVWALRQRIDVLRIVEVLRDYAARHDGGLPDSLDEIENVPVPVDVLSGKPFQYHCEGNVAYLSAEGIKMRGKIRYGIRLRIRVR